MSTVPCNFTPQSCKELTDVRVAQEGTHERIMNLERWQVNQNGHLGRIDDTIAKFFWFWLSIFATSAGTLLLFVLAQFGVIGHR